MTRTCGLTLIAFVIALALGARPAAAQQPTVGTYSYFWTTTTGTPITSITATSDSTVTVQLRIQESGGGNAFATGIAAYDANISWGLSGGGQPLLSFATTGLDGEENTRIKTNPYPVPANGFDGFGAILNSSIATINTNRAVNVVRDVGGPSNPNNWVKQSTSPNTGTSILLMELTFTTSGNTGSTTVTGRQHSNNNLLNYLYDLDEGNPGNEDAYLYLDSAIGNNNAVLTVNVEPIPEPTTILGVCAVALGLVGLVRRRRRKATALAHS